MVPLVSMTFQSECCSTKECISESLGRPYDSCSCKKENLFKNIVWSIFSGMRDVETGKERKIVFFETLRSSRKNVSRLFSGICSKHQYKVLPQMHFLGMAFFFRCMS